MMHLQFKIQIESSHLLLISAVIQSRHNNRKNDMQLKQLILLFVVVCTIVCAMVAQPSLAADRTGAGRDGSFRTMSGRGAIGH